MWGRTRAEPFLTSMAGGEDRGPQAPHPQTLSLWSLEPGVGSNPSRVTLSGCFTSPAPAHGGAQPHSLLSGGMDKSLDCSVPQFPCLSNKGDSNNPDISAASGRVL